jgi:hypothetical protein
MAFHLVRPGAAAAVADDAGDHFRRLAVHHLAQPTPAAPGAGGRRRPAGARCPRKTTAGTTPGWTAPGSRRTPLSWRRAAGRPCHRCGPPGRPCPRPAGDLQVWVHPSRAGDRDVLAGQVRQAAPLCQGHDRDQAGPRHEIRVIKRCVRLRRIMRQPHLRGVLSIGVTATSVTPIAPAQKALFASKGPDGTLATRCTAARRSPRSISQGIA